MIVRPSVTLVDPNADLQAAIDATVPGGTLYLPIAVYTPTTASGFSITKPITIIGIQGDPSNASQATRIRPFGSDAVGGAPNSVGITLVASTSDLTGVHIKNVTVFPDVAPTSTGTGDGIYVDAGHGFSVGLCTFENVSIWRAGRDGFRAIGSGAGFFDQSTLTNVSASACRADGFHYDTTDNIIHIGCRAIGNRVRGFYGSISGGLIFSGWRSNGNQIDTTSPTFPAYGEGQMYLTTCHGTTLVGDFEEFATTGNHHAVVLVNCYGGNYFARAINGSAVADTILYLVLDDTSGAQFSGSCTNVGSFITGYGSGHGCRGLVVNHPARPVYSATCPASINLPSESSSVASGSQGNIIFPSVNDGGSSVLARQTAGIRLPLIDGISAIASPVEGTVVYDGNGRSLVFYNGSAWATIDDSASSVSYEDDYVMYEDSIVTY